MWQPCVQYPDYQVSSNGEVRRVNGGRNGLLGQKRTLRVSQGYLKVTINLGDGAAKIVSVARLVCTAFHGSPIEGMQVNHINGIKQDNRAENLEWVTPSENVRHRFDVLKIQNLRNEQHQNAKLTNNDIHVIRALHKNGCVPSAIASQFGVTKECIKAIIYKTNWGDLPEKEICIPENYKIIRADETHKRGASHHNAKLNDISVQEIRNRIAKGERQSDLAKEYRVTAALINAIHKQKIWRHV